MNKVIRITVSLQKTSQFYREFIVSGKNIGVLRTLLCVLRVDIFKIHRLTSELVLCLFMCPCDELVTCPGDHAFALRPHEAHNSECSRKRVQKTVNVLFMKISELKQ